MSKWKQTGGLLVLALGLFAFILWHERPTASNGATAHASLLLPSSYKPSATSSVLLRRAGQLSLRAERTGETWKLTDPLAYPASGPIIEAVLHLLSKAEVRTRLPVVDLTVRGHKLGDFGLEVPQAVLVLQQESNRLELQWGTNTASGDQVYVRLAGAPEICVVGLDLAQSLPRSVNDWRDGSLFTTAPHSFDHVAVSRANGDFLLEHDATNRLWRLARPLHRADRLKMSSLLTTLLDARVLSFVTDQPDPDLEAYGLLAPAAEVTLTLGTNVLQRIQFGKSPTNDPSRVFARRLSHHNIVLVSKSLLETLHVPVADLRDRHLLILPPRVDTIEVRSEEPFTLRKQTNDLWMTGEGMVADPTFMRIWLEDISRLQVVEFVKDVVTDFSNFGLASPTRQYLFKTTVTNAVGPTNVVVAQLDFGTNQADRVFVRRTDEDSVYALRLREYYRLPAASWQLRDHQVWSFTTNDVTRVIIRQNGQVRTLLRNSRNEWSSGPDTDPPVNSWSLDETLFQLGDLRAVTWAARGETNRAAFGFSDKGHQITFELKGADKPKTLSLEFGGASLYGLPYAAATVDGQWWIFEFPWPLYPEVKRDLSIAP